MFLLAFAIPTDAGLESDPEADSPIVYRRTLADERTNVVGGRGGVR
jgi:hypothetical protein